jgi:phage tail-like protein
VITDLAFNPLAHGSQVSFLGYSPSSAAFAERSEVMDLDIYRFLIKPIRDADQQDGQEFLWRFLLGPQAIWEQTQRKIQALKDLWSVVYIEDDHLQFLKNIVGWTPDLAHITDGLSALQLRRLINASVPLWRRRGTEDTLVDILKLATGERTRLYNWFDRRLILDEVELGELMVGTDPWLLALPEYPEGHEYQMGLRIVDSGGLNRDLVRGLTILMRPSGERIWIYYLLFLDQFLIDDDASQWDFPAGETLLVQDGVASLEDDAAEEIAFSTAPAAIDWSNYIAAFRVKGTTSAPGDRFGALFLYQDEENFYFAELDVGGNALVLGKVEAGVASTLATYDFSTELQTLHDSVWYVIRVHAFEEGAATRVQVHVDGDLKLNVLDSTFTEGGVAIRHTTGAKIWLDIVEIMGLPVDREFVDINQSY